MTVENISGSISAKESRPGLKPRHWAYYNTFQTIWIIFRLKQKYSTVSVCSLFCTLMWLLTWFLSVFFFFFFFFFFVVVFCFLLLLFFCFCFFHEKFLGIIYLIKIQRNTQVFSLARSRFLVFPREMVWLYILVRLMSNLFSFLSKHLINLNKAYIKKSHFCSFLPVTLKIY